LRKNPVALSHRIADDGGYKPNGNYPATAIGITLRGMRIMQCLRRALVTNIALFTLVIAGPRTGWSATSFSGDVTFGSTTTIGNTAFGTFRIDGGSVYNNTSFATVIIGSQSTGLGLVTVTDSGSQWVVSNSNGFTVGASGVGRLDVLNGGAVTWSGSSGGVTIASNSGSEGTVNVQGSGSTLYTPGLTLGQSSTSGGSALLQIGSGALVMATATSNATTIWNGGRVELTGGVLRTTQLTQNGAIVGNGEIALQSSSSFTNAGRLEADANQLLRITGASTSYTNTGSIIADGGEIELQRATTNSTSGSSAGEISLRNGRLRAGTAVIGTGSAQLTNSGNLASIGGESDVYGRVTNTSGGHIAATNDSVLRFHDDVTADGVITVFPGSTAIFLEDLTMNAGATLQANLAGTNPTTNYGTAEVVGTATLAGSLAATLENGFAPHVGDTFTLLSASSLSGSPALGAMPALPGGLMWDLDAVANQLILSIVPGLAGDYNKNGVVDTADYVLWNKSVGQTGQDLAADGDANGVVDANDYVFWRNRFGNSVSGGLGASSSVPEPATAMLFFAAWGLVLCHYRKLR
jgi:T5SS/PEP-CTERM-associated repeat protein